MDAELKMFSFFDYLVFGLTTLLCVINGFYFKFVAFSADDPQDNKNKMKAIPVSMSLLASFISIITLFNIVENVNLNGIHYVYASLGIILMALIFGFIYLPVFHKLKITSPYEYLEHRFDKRLKLFGLFQYLLGLVTWLPIIIYVSSNIFNKVTGIDMKFVILSIGIISIFFSSLGGIEAVIWMDMVLILVTFVSMILVIVKGTINVGGIYTIWDVIQTSEYMINTNVILDDLTGQMLWVLIFGGFLYWLQVGAIDYTILQKYMCLPTLRSAKSTLSLFLIEILIFVGMNSYIGMLIYTSYYKKCNVTDTKIIKNSYLSTHSFATTTLRDWGCIIGFYFVGTFTASFSSFAAALNSLTTIVQEEILLCTNEKYNRICRQIVLIMAAAFICAVCIGFTFLIGHMSLLLQVAVCVLSIVSSITLSLFTMGILFPWISGKGALFGSTLGLLIMSVVCFYTQRIKPNMIPTDFVTNGFILDECVKSISNETMTINIVPSPTGNVTNFKYIDEYVGLIDYSYLLYLMVGTALCIILSLSFSACTEWNDPRDIDPMLLSPFVRKMIKPRKFARQPENPNDIIDAYSQRPNFGSDKIAYQTVQLHKI